MRKTCEIHLRERLSGEFRGSEWKGGGRSLFLRESCVREEGARNARPFPEGSPLMASPALLLRKENNKEKCARGAPG
jgi:hypothetical protein